jgi:nicotinate-nucleotide pyrophosphorylase (carboxylating)
MRVPEVPILSPHPLLYRNTVRRALLEDLGRAGDITTDAIVPAEEEAAASINARAEGRLAGLNVAVYAFLCLDERVHADVQVADGCDIAAGEQLAVLRGPARAILSAERTALNFLGRLCGIATATHRIAAAIAPFAAKVVCTRKTTPGLRVLEKYAVRAGGLDDAVMIKDNHRIIAGGIAAAVQRVRRHAGHMVKVEVEVDTLEELEEALGLGVDAILLDNMSPASLSEAVRMAKGKALLEASGGITPENAAAIAATGVDLLSIGWLTHSSPALDVALDFSVRI